MSSSVSIPCAVLSAVLSARTMVFWAPRALRFSIGLESSGNLGTAGRRHRIHIKWSASMWGFEKKVFVRM